MELIKKFFHNLYMKWPRYIFALLLIVTEFRLLSLSIDTISFVVSISFFILIIISTRFIKQLFIRYTFAILGLGMYILSIKVLNIDFATVTTFIFYMPVICAFLLPDPFSTLIMGIMLSYILSTYMGGVIPDHTIMGTMISMMNASFSYTMIAYLIRKLTSTNNELVHVNNELQKLNTQLKQLSIIDGLTGIYNRRYFDVELERIYRSAKSSSKPISLIMIDIDFFKIYNDTYGHQEGDKCLVLVAATLNETIRNPEDMLARYGGEEFVVILPKTNREKAKTVAENLRRRVEDLRIPHVNSKVSNTVTISVGVATLIPDIHVTSNKLVGFADKALYEAKKDGRNTVRVYSENS